jgi:hypothetical protein
MSYIGDIIAESLEDTSILKDVNIVSTRVEPVTEEHQTPWLTQWTLHTIDVADGDAVSLAERLSHALDRHQNWYVDFKNSFTHFVIFRDKVFRIDRRRKDEYRDMQAYGIAQGVPEYQLPDMEE